MPSLSPFFASEVIPNHQPAILHVLYQFSFAGTFQQVRKAQRRIAELKGICSIYCNRHPPSTGSHKGMFNLASNNRPVKHQLERALDNILWRSSKALTGAYEQIDFPNSVSCDLLIRTVQCITLCNSLILTFILCLYYHGSLKGSIKVNEIPLKRSLHQIQPEAMEEDENTWEKELNGYVTNDINSSGKRTEVPLTCRQNLT